MEVLEHNTTEIGGGETAANLQRGGETASAEAETCATVVGGAFKEIATSARAGLSDLARFVSRFVVQYPDRSNDS